MKRPPSQMIWGAMSCRGAAGLYFILSITAMNRPKYAECQAVIDSKGGHTQY